MCWTQGIPVVGAILVSPGLDRCLLVRGWGAQASWGFPRGKINEHEPDAACAVREVSALKVPGIGLGFKIELRSKTPALQLQRPQNRRRLRRQ